MNEAMAEKQEDELDHPKPYENDGGVDVDEDLVGKIKKRRLMFPRKRHVVQLRRH